MCMEQKQIQKFMAAGQCLFAIFLIFFSGKADATFIHHRIGALHGGDFDGGYGGGFAIGLAGGFGGGFGGGFSGASSLASSSAVASSSSYSGAGGWSAGNSLDVGGALGSNPFLPGLAKDGDLSVSLEKTVNLNGVPDLVGGILSGVSQLQSDIHNAIAACNGGPCGGGIVGHKRLTYPGPHGYDGSANAFAGASASASASASAGAYGQNKPSTRSGKNCGPRGCNPDGVIIERDYEANPSNCNSPNCDGSKQSKPSTSYIPPPAHSVPQHQPQPLPQQPNYSPPSSHRVIPVNNPQATPSDGPGNWQPAKNPETICLGNACNGQPGYSPSNQPVPVPSFVARPSYGSARPSNGCANGACGKPQTQPSQPAASGCSSGSCNQNPTYPAPSYPQTGCSFGNCGQPGSYGNAPPSSGPCSDGSCVQPSGPPKIPTNVIRQPTQTSSGCAGGNCNGNPGNTGNSQPQPNPGSGLHIEPIYSPAYASTPCATGNCPNTNGPASNDFAGAGAGSLSSADAASSAYAGSGNDVSTNSNKCANGACNAFDTGISNPFFGQAFIKTVPTSNGCASGKCGGNGGHQPSGDCISGKCGQRSNGSYGINGALSGSFAVASSSSSSSAKSGSYGR